MMGEILRSGPGKLASRLLIVAVVVAGIVFVAMNRDTIDPENLQTWLDGFGALAPVVFMLAYVLATVFFLPGLLFTIAAGALFGPYYGTLFSLIGATAGATIAFLAARYALADWVENRSPARVRQVIDGVDEEGWRFVALTRLMPFIPFNALNYVLGLTRIPTLHYTFASFIFMAPGAAAYAYLGYAGREVAAGSEGLVQKALLGLAALALISFLPRVIKRFRRKKEAT